MTKYKNKNELTKKYRYKLIETTNNRFSDIVFEPMPISHNTHRSVNGKGFHFIPYDYKPYWIFRYLWSFINRYKRPKLKKIKANPIVSKIFRFISKFIIQLLIALIVAIVLFVFGDDIKQYLK